ncbi:MAG: chlorophyllide a reductase subunit Y [Pseudomonadota bacterium]
MTRFDAMDFDRPPPTSASPPTGEDREVFNVTYDESGQILVNGKPVGAASSTQSKQPVEAIASNAAAGSISPVAARPPEGVGVSESASISPIVPISPVRALEDRAALNDASQPTGDAASEGAGCHAGKDTLKKAAEAAGQSELLDKFAQDYPMGPHDQPQSMCPAFGSLRVGLRMKRTATVLSGSACCVYGLTFTSHFYGARRTVGYVPFNSETLVTGKLFEDIREAVFDLAKPEDYDAIVITNLCVPTASGVPLRLLPKQINGVRIIGIDVPGFGVPTHAEAKDVLAGAMLKYAREEALEGPVQAPTAPKPDRPTVSLVGEMFPADPVVIGQLLAPMGLSVGPVVPTREWRELYSALDCVAVAGIHPFYTSVFREFEAAGRMVIPSAPVGRDGTAEWLEAIGEVCGVARRKVQETKAAILPAIEGALKSVPVKGRITVSGYEGSELLVARLLVESGADVRYVGSALPRTRFSDPDREWLQAKGVHVQVRASLEQDVAAIHEYQPDLAIGTTPVVQKAKELSIPGLYFTNLISARPLMGPAGAGSLGQVVNAAIGNKARFDAMTEFFEGVGTGYAAGVWRETPKDNVNFRKKYAAKLSGGGTRVVEGSIGC